MVVDNIQQASLYYALSPGIETALRYLASTDLRAAQPGRHELAGGCFALVQDYDTMPREEKKWEAHRKYIDVQFIARGVELMGYAPVGDPSTSSGCSGLASALRSVEEYDDPKDVEFFEGDGSFVVAREAVFIILFPHDAHMPGVAEISPGPVRKVVVKVPIER